MAKSRAKRLEFLFSQHHAEHNPTGWSAAMFTFDHLSRVDSSLGVDKDGSPNSLGRCMVGWGRFSKEKRKEKKQTKKKSRRDEEIKRKEKKRKMMNKRRIDQRK